MTLDELMALIPRVIPKATQKEDRLLGLQVNSAASVVTFTWHKLHFVAKLNLEVFELKQDKLYITGSSLLMTQILSSGSRRENTLGEVLETMKQAEDLIISGNPGSAKSGLELLGAVIKALSKMRLPPRKPPPARTLIP
ncbi:MAG: hypothetical protein Q7S86_01640 [bacterium]|nr:hypothetical protein [bacterium]